MSGTRERMTSRPRRGIASVAAALAAVGVASLPWWAPIASAAPPRLSLTQPADAMRPGSLSSTAPERGMWSSVAQWPSVPLHAVLTQDGELVTYGALVTPDNTIAQGGLQYDTWNPGTGAHRLSDFVGVDSFCSIAVPQADNRLFVVGGNTQYSAGVFDPNGSGQQFTRLSTDLQQPRWYGSLIRLPDDRMVIVGGSQPHQSEPVLDQNVALTPEIYTPGQGWRSLSGATSATFFGGAQSRWWYPKSWLAPNGKIFGISYDRMWQLDINGNGGSGAITSKGTITSAQSTALGPAASGVMYAPGKILLSGGNQISNMTVSNASRDAIVIDITNLDAGATVTETGSMVRGRNWNNLLVMPDGDVIAVGGTPVGNDTTINPSLSAEVWDPGTGTWTELASATRPRSYHNTAILLPIGAVFSGGGGAPGYPDNTYSQENAELFYPPNLFTRVNGTVQWASRPLITSMAGYLQRGGTITMDMNDNRAISAVSLITLGANTHSVSMSERRVPITNFSKTGSVLTATLPSSSSMLPPGLYQLTAVDANGVPSPGQIIEINADNSPGQVTVYGSGPQVPPTTGVTPPTTSTTTTTTTTTTVAPTTTSPVVTVPATKPATFTGTTPVRLLDTRPGLPALAHASIEQVEAAPAGPGSTTVIQVAGSGPVPANGVGAVALNVTVTNPTAESYLTVYPTGKERPTASNLNVSPGRTTPNMVVVPLGTNGRVSIFNQTGNVDLVVDVLGWFPSGGGFNGVTPARLADTRALPTVDGKATALGAVPGGWKLTVPVTGRGGVPIGASAVALNVTGTDATLPTYLTVWPSGAERPTASNLNLTPGLTSPNMVIVPVGANGSIDVFNASGATDVVVDVLGWFAPGSGFTGLTPARLMDSRSDGITVDGAARAEGALTGGVGRRLQVAGRGGVGARPGSVVLNVTVTEPAAPGFLTVYPTGTQVPTASNLNYIAGQTVPNMVVVPVAADGTISLFASGGPVHVVVDVLGWFPAS